jgi:ribosome maturation factor RimP
VVEQYVAAEGIELDDLEVAGNGNGTIIRVTVDAGEPVGVDRIASLSRGISRLLDMEDPIAGSYTLEVGSPGLERKLRRPAHFAKSVGRDAKVKVKGPEGFETLRGTIAAANGSGFDLDLDEGRRRLEFSDVTSASTIFTWEKNPKPGNREGR